MHVSYVWKLNVKKIGTYTVTYSISFTYAGTSINKTVKQTVTVQ